MTIFPSQRWQVNLKLTREVARVDVPTDEEALDDLGRNADLYIFHQDDPDSQQVNDIRSQRQLQSQQGADVHKSFSVACSRLSLVL